MKSLVNIDNQNKNNIYKQLTNVKYNEENLLKYNKSFENKNGKMRNLLILGTNKSLGLCNDDNCKQFFADSTYRAFPSNSEFKALCVMITYNLKNKLYELVNIALLEDETEETYNEYYSILKNKYSFSPQIITVD